MAYNLSTVFGALIDGSPIIVILIALITWVGTLGVTGKAQLLAGFGLGFAVGAGYLVSELGWPVAFAAGSTWFSMAW